MRLSPHQAFKPFKRFKSFKPCADPLDLDTSESESQPEESRRLSIFDVLRIVKTSKGQVEKRVKGLYAPLRLLFVDLELLRHL
jgi:hypothetical protein